LQVGLPWGAALLVGLVSVLYADLSTDASNAFLHLIAGRSWLAFVVTPALTVTALFLTRRWFTGSEGSGIPQVIAALHAPRAQEDTLMRRLFGLRVIVGKIAVSLIGLLGGLTIGREGPTVHIGAAIMAETRRFYPHRNAQLERRLLLAGAAAGLSAAFNTPLAGIIFAIEELARDFESRTNGIMITAVVFSGLTSLALAGNYLYFGQIDAPQNLGGAFVLPVILAAALCGLFGAAFNLAVLRWRSWMPDWLITLRARWPLLYALIVGILRGGARRRHTWGNMGQWLRPGAPPADGHGAALRSLWAHQVGRHGGDLHGRHSGRPLLADSIDRRGARAVGACGVRLGADGGGDSALHDGVSRGGHAITDHVLCHRDGDDQRHWNGHSDDGDGAHRLAHLRFLHAASL
jgi:hypothetical protein